MKLAVEKRLLSQAWCDCVGNRLVKWSAVVEANCCRDVQPGSCGFRVDGTISKGVVDIDLHIKVYTVYIYIYKTSLGLCHLL